MEINHLEREWKSIRWAQPVQHESEVEEGKVTLNQSMHKPKGKGVEPKIGLNKDEQVRVTKIWKGRQTEIKGSCFTTGTGVARDESRVQ